MAEEDDSKTEHPTGKRLTEAQEKGNIPHSREVNHFLILLILAFTIGVFAPAMLSNTKLLLIPFLADADSMAMDAVSIGQILFAVLTDSIAIIALPVLCVIVVAITSRWLQGGAFVLSLQPLIPQLSRISPKAALGKIFSMQSIVDLIKNIIKFIIVGWVGYSAVASELTHVRQLPDSSVLSLLLFMGKLAIKLMIGILIAMFFIALLDFIYQRFNYFKKLRMTKQEVKDEFKQSEGDPAIKRRLRVLRLERARQRMISAVPKADVVITNPTHYAVALKYDNAVMKAPVIVAKGQDLVALKIREVAEEHDIPIVENPPLARALFDSGEIDQEIPLTHYEAVAKVISYVYQLKGRKIA